MSAATVVGASAYLMIVNVITVLGSLYTLLIFIWAIFSWFNHNRGLLRDIYGVLDKLAGPYVRLFNRFIPPLGGMNFSPLIAIIVLQIVVQILIQVARVFFAPF